jgi:hypothetical protein
LFIQNYSKEYYGQDASIRASAGWVAGRGMYGIDPVAEFAKEIEEMKRKDQNQTCGACR